MEILYNILYRWFSTELLNINIGYSINNKRLSQMTDLINAIDYITNGNPTNDEIISIIRYYEEL